MRIIFTIVLVSGVMSALLAESGGGIDPVKAANAYTAMLERALPQIEYCRANLNHKFSEIDMEKAIIPPSHIDVGIVTYGAIAMKYIRQYHDEGKAADYYYLEWKHTPMKHWPTGEYNPLSDAIGYWREAGRYDDMVKHYDEYLIASYSPLKVGSMQEKRKAMEKNLSNNEEMRDAYNNDLKDLVKYKDLAKKKDVVPLNPAVQNHERYYSDKQDEVLKALEYYHANKVQFMLEKALKHKDPAVAAKAKEYLDSLIKVETNGKESK